MRMLSISIIVLLLAGQLLSCKQHYPTETKKCDTCDTDTTHHPCDTCNINQDSLQRAKDSLAHAWVWTEYSIPGETNLTGVWVFSPSNIYIVGNNLYKFDGATFKQVHVRDATFGVTMDGVLNGANMFAIDTNDYWLIQTGGAAYHTADGYSFDDYRPGHTSAGWGPSSNDIFVVGNAGQIHHYDGTKFTDMVSPTTKDLRSVWGTSHNDVWACGYSSSKGETILIHFDGGTWQEDPVSVQNNTVTGGFTGVWACDSSGHRFVTTSGATLIRKTDDNLWRSDSGLISNYLGGNSFVSIVPHGNSASDLMVSGPWGFISHWNGKDWKQFKSLYDYSITNYYTSAFSINGNTACAVGGKNGQSWVAIGRRAK